jgi:hypothetical protein
MKTRDASGDLGDASEYVCETELDEERFTTAEPASVVSHVVATAASQPLPHEPTSGTTAAGRND